MPDELRGLATGGKQLNVDLVDKTSEDYVPPKRTVKSFAGAGYRLGSPAPAMPATAASTVAALSPTTAAAAPSFNPDEPQTKLQVQETSAIVYHLTSLHCCLCWEWQSM